MAIVVERYIHLGSMLSQGAFTGTVKVALVTSAYSFNAANTVFADVATAEAVGAGYTAGGAVLANMAYISTVGGFYITSDDAVWLNLSLTFRRAIVYVLGTVGGVVNPLLISYLLDDTPADIVISSTDWTVAIPNAGLVNVTWT